jgi:hypothetical protein
MDLEGNNRDCNSGKESQNGELDLNKCQDSSVPVGDGQLCCAWAQLFAVWRGAVILTGRMFAY